MPSMSFLVFLIHPRHGHLPPSDSAGVVLQEELSEIRDLVSDIVDFAQVCMRMCIAVFGISLYDFLLWW